MYDFILAEADGITRGGVEAEKTFLLSVKRMMPRWCNSIPDSEFLAIYDVLAGNTLISPYFVETGSGASTLILFWFAMKLNGKLYSWDTNGSKLHFLRSVIQDAILRMYPEHSLWQHWCPVSMMSTSHYAGIASLSEISDIAKKGVAACFLDSEHTVDNLLAESKMVFSLMKEGSLFIIDDSNYTSKYVNMAFVNMVRRKMGLSPVEEPADNISEKNFGESVEAFLKENAPQIEHIDDTYKKYYKDDLFWSYYRADRDKMAEMGMEHYENLAHRFDAWKIVKK